MFKWIILLTVLGSTSTSRGQIETPRAVDGRLTVELFAAEPEIVTPIGIAVDAQGRVLVIESHTHFRTEDYKGPPADRIRMMQDTNGDGRADRVTTFFQGTSATMNIAIHDNGWVYVATRKEIFRIRDTTGDAVADQRQMIANLETKSVYPHNGLSGFALDFAGNVYFSLGENQGADYRLVGSDAAVLEGGRSLGCIFRCRPDGSGLHRVARGFWNPFHLCFDTYGRLFAVDNDPHNRPPCRLLSIVEGGQYGFRTKRGQNFQNSTLQPFISWNGEVPGTLPMICSTGEAPTGMLAYESDHLPPEYRGDLLVSVWGEHRVDRYRLQEEGASFRATAEPLVIGGKRFRPSGIAMAPDGSLYFSDWADRSYNTHGAGRIWHLRAVNRKRVERPDDPRQALGSPHRPLRESAARRLAAAGKDGRSYLAQMLRGSPDPRVRSLALATIVHAAAMTKQLADAVRADPFPAIRLQAVRTLPEKFADYSSVARHDASAAVRAAAMRRMNDRGAVALLLEQLEHPDSYIRQAARMGLRRLAEKEELLEYSRHNKAAVRLAALLLLRQIDPSTGSKVLPSALKDVDPRVRFVAVQWIWDHDLTEFRDELEAGLLHSATTRPLFEAYLAALAQMDTVKQESDFHKYAAKVLSNAQAPASVLKLALAYLPPDHPSLTVPRLEKFLATGDLQVQTEAITALRTIGKPAAKTVLMNLATDSSKPAELRAEAIVGLDANTTTGRAALLALAREKTPTVRHEALRGLRGAKLEVDQHKQLLLLAGEDPASGELVRKIIDPNHAFKRPAVTDLTAWMKRLQGPANPRAGRRIFFHPQGPGCYQCHRIDGRGKEVGPTFPRTSGIQGFTRRRLVESIVQPSKEIGPAYVRWLIVTTDGRVASGIIYKERTFFNENGNLMAFKDQDIEQLIPQETSLMPDGLIKLMTMQEFRDLLAFLMEHD